MTTTTSVAGAPAEDSALPRREIRVASVPFSHVYVRHLASEMLDDGVVRLPDPDPDLPDRPAGARWWPPAMLEPGWVEEHHDDFDVFHVHFGFDACSADGLTELVRALRRHGKPLVYTVHDLRNPHHEDPQEHERHLAVLVSNADALVTLTSGAAKAVERRWGRRPVVIPHPHVVDLATMRQTVRPPARQDFRIGVHVKSRRPSMDPLPVLRVLVAELRSMPGAVLQVNGHRDLLDPRGARYDLVLAESLAAWESAGLADVRVHDFLPDEELWDYLSSLDVSVLPYRFGTHSGWLEACRDLGTLVLAPDCGFYADQAPVVSYHHDESGLDEESLRSAIRCAHAERPSFSVTVAERRRQRDEIAAAHLRLYQSLLG